MGMIALTRKTPSQRRDGLRLRYVAPLRWVFMWLSAESAPRLERGPVWAEMSSPGGSAERDSAFDRLYRLHSRTVMAYLYHRLPTLWMPRMP